MEDNKSQIIEDIKYTLFNDRDFDPFLNFVKWTGDGNSFIIEDENNEKYKISISKE
jgi:hypothetical protein